MNLINIVAWLCGIAGLVIFFKYSHRTYYLFIAITTIPYILPSIQKRVWVNVFMGLAYGFVATYNFIKRK
jgi:hypothetical protein